MGVTSVQAVLLGSIDYVWERVRGRLHGMSDEEYLWEPVPGCWTVRDGVADWMEPEPEPAPVTTIAWRTWHIASALDGYSDRLFGRTGLGLGLGVGQQHWYAITEEAGAGLDRAWSVFRDGFVGLGEEGLWRPLGPAFGPYGDDTCAALLLHAQDEVSHHGAEISLLRDLYATWPS